VHLQILKIYYTFLVLRPQFVKSLRPSKVKTKTKTTLAKTRPRPQKNGLKTKAGLKDYITVLEMSTVRKIDSESGPGSED